MIFSDQKILESIESKAIVIEPYFESILDRRQIDINPATFSITMVSR